MKLVTVAEMRAIEQQANAGGLSFNQMMSNAGLGLAGIIKNYYSPENEKWVVGLVGSGNNGGDTLVALSELAGEGWHACAYLLQARKKGDALVKSLTVAGGLVIEMGQDLDFTQLDKWLGNCAVLLDGVLGTGIRLPLKPDAANLLEHVQQYRPLPHVVAVDCPSGVDCENGKAASECIPAELTVCMAAVKTGLLNFPAFEFVGDIQVTGIGLDENLSGWKEIKRVVLDDSYVQDALPTRGLNAHKGTFGTATIAAGSINYTLSLIHI